MPEEKEDKQEETFYEDIRADVETAIYVFSSLEEIDAMMYGKELVTKLAQCKKNCLSIVCKGIEALKDSYD